MAVEYDVEIDGFHFILVSYGYQIDADAYTAKSAHVMVDTNDFLDDEQRTRYLRALEQACKYAESFDTMSKACEFVLSEESMTALSTWEGGQLHGHGLLCDGAIYASDTYGFPLSEDLKKKLRDWNQAAWERMHREK